MARRLVHVLVIVLTLVVGATAAAIIVSQTAWFKNWLRGYIIEQSAQVPERAGDDRAAGRQPVLRRRDGERRHLDGRQRGRGDRGPRPRLQRLPDDHARHVDRRHPPEPAGALPQAGWRGVVDRAADQEAGAGSGSRRAGVADLDRQHRGHRRLGCRRRSGRHERRRRARSLRSDRRAAVVPVRTGALLARRSRGSASAAPSRRSRSTSCRGTCRSATTPSSSRTSRSGPRSRRSGSTARSSSTWRSRSSSCRRRRTSCRCRRLRASCRRSPGSRCSRRSRSRSTVRWIGSAST